MNRLLSLATASLAVTSAAVAQAQLTNIVDFTGSTAYINGSSEHRMAVSMDGSLYAVLKLGSPLAIVKSTDGGATWNTVETDTTGGNPSGNGIVTGSDCNILHVGFHARVGYNLEAPHYRQFDTTTDTWVGPAVLVNNLATPTIDWRFADIEVTDNGTVVVAYKSDSTAPYGFKNSAGYISVMPAGQTSFGPPIQVSTGGNGSGLRNQLHAIGEVIHMTFRWSSGGHSLVYRAFDTETMAFVNSQVVIDGPKATIPSKDITSYHTTVFDDFNRMYTLYGVGDTGLTNDGEYKLAYADAPYDNWTILKVADDFAVKGRTDTKHFSLVHTTSDDIHCLYSKVSPPDNLDTLYTRQLVNGALTPETVLVTNQPGLTFETVWGSRSQHSNTGYIAYIQDESPLPKRNHWFLNNSGAAGRTRAFGAPCRGNLAEFPTLSTDRMPEAGVIVPLLNMTLQQMPATSPGALIVGVTCLNTPLSLGPSGAPGCSLPMVPFVQLSGFTTDAAGRAALPIVIQPQWAGIPINFHSYVLAPGANTLGVILSNALMIVG